MLRLHEGGNRVDTFGYNGLSLRSSPLYPNAKPKELFEKKVSSKIDNIKSQLADGSWNIPWGWKAYPEEWSVSKNWWKANSAILNLIYLKGMGKL
jgi:hypothetical protein